MLKEIVLPEISDSVSTADVLKILVVSGDRVKVEQPIFELETEKAVFEFPSPQAGVVKEVRVKVGDKVAVGQVLLLLESEGATEAPVPPRPAVPAPVSHPTPQSSSQAIPPPPEQPLPLQAPPSQPGEPGRTGPAAPHVRRLARELGVEISRVPGTGPKGRVTEEDVQRASLGHLAAAPTAPPSPLPATPAPTLVPRAGERREPMSNVRRITAETLARAWATIPQVTGHDRADITALEVFRKKHGPQVEKAGGKLTVTAVLIKVCSEALRRFPQFNASVDMERSEIVFREEVGVGVAVDSDRGLLVPVVRTADRKSVTELAVELTQLSEKARTKRLTPAEMEGGTFTISNLGGIGGTAFSPIVYPPQVAILGVSRSSTEPLWKDGVFVPRLLLPLSLTYDHRLIDGADGARFLRWVCEALEDPWDKWI
jgi:pyruvate dehydrogenase E2 component (dihydrolipoamide acetyltransferase)